MIPLDQMRREIAESLEKLRKNIDGAVSSSTPLTSEIIGLIDFTETAIEWFCSDCFEHELYPKVEDCSVHPGAIRALHVALCGRNRT